MNTVTTVDTGSNPVVDFFSGLLGGAFGVVGLVLGLYFMAVVLLAFKGGAMIWLRGWTNWRNVTRLAIWMNVAFGVVALLTATGGAGGSSLAFALGYLPSSVAVALLVRKQLDR
jgi:hypothetical protein